MSGASSWSFREEDSKRIHVILMAFLRESNARTGMIVDRTGQMVATVGDEPTFDPTASSLTAADFSANNQLARIIGEPEFGSLFHQGEKESMYLADIARRVILVVLFDNRTTLGLVELRVRQTVAELSKVFDDMFSHGGAGHLEVIFKSGRVATVDEIKASINEINTLSNQLEKNRTDFINSLSDILSYEQIAKLLVFERKFKDEIRRLIMKERRPPPPDQE